VHDVYKLDFWMQVVSAKLVTDSDVLDKILIAVINVPKVIIATRRSVVSKSIMCSLELDICL